MAPPSTAGPSHDRHQTSPVPVHTVVVLAGGDRIDVAVAADLPPQAVVIAADSGLEFAAPLGLTVDRIVGDLDSVDAGVLAEARTAGIPVDAYPRDKDSTDLAIAMDAALSHTPTRILVVGGHGGRLDHLLGNAALIASSAYEDVEVVALMGTARVTVIRGHPEPLATTLNGRIGELISLLPFHGEVAGVTTSGLRFPLDDAALSAGSSMGVSNEFVEPQAGVALRSGVLLAVQPNHL